MCAFRAHHSGLDNLLRSSSSLKKTDSPSFHTLWLPVALHRGWSLVKFLPSVQSCQLVLSYASSYIVNIHGCSFPIVSRGHCFPAGEVLWLSVFLPHLCGFPWTLDLDDTLDISVGARISGSFILCIWTSCGSLWESPSVAKRSFSGERWELQLSVGIKICI